MSTAETELEMWRRRAHEQLALQDAYEEILVDIAERAGALGPTYHRMSSDAVSCEYMGDGKGEKSCEAVGWPEDGFVRGEDLMGSGVTWWCPKHSGATDD